MRAVLKNNRQIEFMLLNKALLKDLCVYLNALSAETVKRFSPHAFDLGSVEKLYKPGTGYMGYIALDNASRKIIAYAIVKTGYLEHDAARLNAYGQCLSMATDCTFAPSVADEWQGMGVADELFEFIYTHVKEKGFRRIILWGGVQAANEPALKFYFKKKFKVLGQFSYHGENYDMALEIN